MYIVFIIEDVTSYSSHFLGLSPRLASCIGVCMICGPGRTACANVKMMHSISTMYIYIFVFSKEKRTYLGVYS